MASPTEEIDNTTHDVQRATLNILDDFNAEKARLEESQRAVLNILEDFNYEKAGLRDTQKATLNILEDFNYENLQAENTQRAVLNILDDFNAEKAGLENTQRATLNILEDFNYEKLQAENTQRAVLNILDDLNISNEELKQSREVLETRVQERTAELRKSLREKEVLLREVHHRVKNNLQIIHSMLNLQLPYLKDAESVMTFKESQNRVFTMALIHEKLYQSESLITIDLKEYIQGLITNLFLTYGVSEGKVKASIQIGDSALDVEKIIPCGLIINELVSNSLKYAFPDSRRGDGKPEISISLYEDEMNGFVLAVKDNGIGLPEGFQIEVSRTLGLKLVSVLAGQLGGTLRIGRGGPSASPGAGWTEFTITFPAQKD